MKNLAKLFVLLGLGVLLITGLWGCARNGDTSAKLSDSPTPTPAANANAAANTNTTAANTNTGGDKTIPKDFTLGKDSLDPDYHEVAFNHDNHAFQKYSADGQSVMACTECHHTDQPKSALKPPDVTSERDVALTLDVFKSSSQKVSECRSCHFQDGNVPEGKTMPTSGGKDMNNQNAFHINCNTCHDNAAKLRPELKSKPGFATSKDCAKCHKSGSA